MTVGQFATFFAYVTIISGPFYTLAGVIGQWQNFNVSGNRLFTFLNTPIAIVDGDQSNIQKMPNILVKNIGVTIDSNTILKDISVQIPYGKKIGIMGKTGSGKSTFIKSLCRFVDCDEGEILMDDINIKKLKVEDLRRQYSYVMQDVFLFSDTVANNIAFYDPFADINGIQTVAK